MYMYVHAPEKHIHVINLLTQFKTVHSQSVYNVR